MIELRGLSVDLGASMLDAIDLTVPSRSLCLLTGASGAGKSSLLETVVGLRVPRRGTILIGGRDVTRLAPDRRAIGYVPQRPVLFPHLSVGEQLDMPLRVRRWSTGRRQHAVEAAASATGVNHLLSRPPDHLSGGEQQRVSLARVLAFEPPVVLLDEPFSALGEPHRRELLEVVIAHQRRHGTTILMVTHFPEEAAAAADQWVQLRDGGLHDLTRRLPSRPGPEPPAADG